MIGVPGYSNEKDNNLGNVFLLPFKKQRDYWKKPDGSIQIKRDEYNSENKARLEE